MGDLGEGDLVITELMPYPGAAPEYSWFEVANLTGEVVLLDGLQVETIYSRGEVDGAVVVEVDGRVVFGVDDDERINGGVPVDAASWDFWLGGEERSTLTLRADRTVVDAVTFMFGDWPMDWGVSASLDPDHVDASDNDIPSNWCAAVDRFGDGDLGSPGESNPDC